MAKTSPVKRVTRARAAAKKTDDAVETAPKRLGASKVTKITTTRKPKTVTKKDEPEAEAMEQPKKTAPKAAAKTSATLTAPARRRVKVTPLDAPAQVDEPASEPPKQETKAKKSTRTKKDVAATKSEEPMTTAKTRTRATKTATSKAPEKPVAAPKTRGRPKCGAEEIEEQPVAEEPKPTTRQTRARSASNTESSAPAETTSKPGGRKKVTFQDVHEDDKENRVVATRRTAKKDSAPATGMRAKPVRKPVATTKKAAATKVKAAREPPRALTPKKITQVNRPTTPESDVEDELNGAKTPVRDLSLSPKRNAQLASRLSPAKKIDFSQTLAPESPRTKTDNNGLRSPARRPASPAKEAGLQSPLKMSPKRVEVPPVFPVTSQQTVNAAASLSPSMQSKLLQSPKRMVLNESAFSQSAMKPTRSPLKASLLQSPPRRLFAPAKPKTPATVGGKGKENDVSMLNANTPDEVAVSSHFRASVSPQRSGRVHRMSEEELADELRNEIDFDQSLLGLGSPLKVAENTSTAAKPQRELADAPNLMSHYLEAEQQQQEEQSEVDANETIGDSSSDASLDGGQLQEDVAETVPERPVLADNVDAAIPTAVSGSETAIDKSRAQPRLSQILFRSNYLRDSDESSEDELAADMTPDRAPRPFRSSLTGVNARARLSKGVETERDADFTPLAAQMSGWFAASPDKKIQKTPARGTFSPIAAQHIDGEVVISRQSTPQHKSSPVIKQAETLRKSLAPRTSMAPSLVASPEKTSFFEEQMSGLENAGRDDEDELEPIPAETPELNRLAMAEIMEDTEYLFDDEEGDTVILKQGNGELTTDLINFTNASDTALVDFAELAHEAEALADVEEDGQRFSPESVYGDENVAPAEASVGTSEGQQQGTIVAADEVVAEDTSEEEVELVPDNVPADVTGIIRASPIKHAITYEERQAIADDISEDVTGLVQVFEADGSSPAPATEQQADLITPVRSNLNTQRNANTVVSKVPLRPEGDMSPIRITKKRSRSLSMAKTESPPKRSQITPPSMFVPRSISENALTPERRLRSAAPSPAHTTPGQTSFAIDDFGDSTLDGIEVPDDEMEFDVGPPSTVKSRKGLHSVAPTPTRTPLRAVGGGILNGAVVYVEVHTTEGADASGVYVDLLNQMGAKCVRDWRWNPRASISMAEDAQTPGKVGITHVVYKDGGKRTLEKVRDTKGDAWCVGVRWVLE